MLVTLACASPHQHRAQHPSLHGSIARITARCSSSPPNPTPSPSPAKPKRAAKRAAARKRDDDIEAKPLPWVPSSDGGVSFNLAAACNYALRKTHQPAV